MQSTFLEKQKLWITASLLMFLILSGGAYTGYAMLDWFKDPKTIYLQSELKQIQKQTSALKEMDARYNETIAPYLNKPFHNITELSDVTIEATPTDPKLKKAQELIKDARLKMDVQADDQSKKAFTKAELMLKDKDVLNLELFLDENRLGLFIPELFNKYAYMNMQTSEQAKKDFPFLESVPDKMFTYEDWMKAVRITPEELTPILLDYGKLFSDRINPDQVTIHKNAIFEEAGVKIPSREITVSFTESELKRLILALSEKLANDKAFQDLIYTRYHDVSELLKGAGYKVDELSKERFTDRWKDAYFNLKDFLDETRLNEDATMVLYIDRNRNILSRTISLNVSSEKMKGRTSVVLKTGHWMDNSTNNGLFSFRTRTDRGEGGEVQITYSNQQEGAANKGKQTSGDFNFKTAVNQNGKEEGMSGSVHSTFSQTEGGRDSSYRVKLNTADLKGSDGLKSISFKLNNQELFGQDVQVPILTVDNSIDLANLTDADRNKLQKQLTKSGERFAQNNADLLQGYFPLDKLFGKSAPIRQLVEIKRSTPVKGTTVEPGAGVKVTSYTITSANPKEKISYPEITGLKNENIQKQINQDLKDLLIPEYTKEDFQWFKYGYDYSADFKVQYFKGNILNLMLETYTYSGGAHGMPDRISYIVNLETGQTYQLSDLFDKNTNYKKVVSDLIPLDTFSRIEEDDGFYLKENGIVVYFRPYQYTSFAEGFPEYELPYSRLDRVLKKESGLWKAMGR